MTTVTAFLITTTIMMGALGIFALNRRSATWELYFGLLLLAAGEWAVGYVFELGTMGLESKLLWAKLEYVGIAAVPLFWFLFATAYTGYEGRIASNHILALSIIPLITVSLVFTNEVHHFIWSSTELAPAGQLTILRVSYGSWFWLHSAYSYILLGVGTYLLMQTLVRYPKSFQSQSVVLVLGALLPWLSNASYILGYSPIEGIDLTPLAFVISGLLFSFAIFRFGLFRLIPIARRFVVDNMAEPMLVLDPKNRLIDINAAAARMFGPVETLIGQPGEPILPEGLLNSDRDELDGYIFYCEQAQRWYDIRVSSLPDGNRHDRGRLIVYHDVTDAQQAAAERAQRTRMLEALNELAQEISGTLDLQTLLETALRVTVEFLQVTSGYVNRWNLANQTLTVLAEYYAEMASDQERESDLGMVYDLAHEFGTPDFSHFENGNYYLAHVEDSDAKIAPAERDHMLRFGGNTVLEILIAVDNETLGSLEVWESRHRHEFSEIEIDFVRSVAQQLGLAMKNAELYQQALAASRLKSGLLARVSHELRTPLSVISLYSQIMADPNYGPLNDRQQRALEKISSNSDVLSDIVSDLLSQAALEAKALVLDNEPFEPAEVMQTVQRRMTLFARKSGCQIDAIIDPALPDVILGDSKSVEQIISHLLHNAIKFTGKGKVRVSLNRPDRNHWAIVVADNGPGIAPEIQQYIYEPFGYGNLNPASDNIGVGVGLSIVKQLVNLMGGDLSLLSRLEEGSTFTATLPLHEPT
ncbi:MAG: PAS domain-containing protein [Anaerolineales bacterium]|nr:PAS domain-containing protein [Anaerolineales bacterium]